MPYTTSYIENEKIVCVRSFGRVALEEYKKGSIEILDLLTKHGSTRLFVDDRFLENAALLADFYELPSYFQKIGLPTSVKAAFLLDAAGANNKDIRFFETVCRNRGYNINIFYSYNEAMEWLKSR